VHAERVCSEPLNRGTEPALASAACADTPARPGCAQPRCDLAGGRLRLAVPGHRRAGHGDLRVHRAIAGLSDGPALCVRVVGITSHAGHLVWELAARL